MRPEVLPYVHKTSHIFVKVANPFGEPLVFSAPSKLGQICSRITGGGGIRRGCTIKHVKPFVE